MYLLSLLISLIDPYVHYFNWFLLTPNFQTVVQYILQYI